MPIEKNYAKNGTDSITSYNYIDIADGTGIIKLFGLDTAVSGAYSYELLTESIASHDIYSTGTNGTSWNFDLSPFNKPQIIMGTSRFRLFGGHDAGAGHVLWYDIYVKKIDLDAVITTIATAQTPQFNSDAGGNPSFRGWTVKLSLPQTHFKRGETLRVTITLRTNGTAYLAHDPLDREGIFSSAYILDDTSSTSLECYIPFKLDI